jgi:hypothetical protein
MNDQNTQPAGTQNSNADEFYKEIEDSAGLTEDQLKVMSAVTEAQIDSSERADEMLKEMEEMADEDDALDE